MVYLYLEYLQINTQIIHMYFLKLYCDLDYKSC